MANPTNSSELPPVRACLFDMDGLLIDSEDIYTFVTNAILRENGRPDLPWNIKAQLQGRPGSSAGRIFREWAQLPIGEDEFLARVSELQRQHFPNCRPLPGVPKLLQTLSSTRPPHKVHIALATSSHQVNYKLKTSHLQSLFEHFPKERRVLGDDPRIPPGRGKPAPDIYLLALSVINDGIRAEGKDKEITPEECLVFEDSVPGVEAGRRAGMRVVWCPHPGLLKEYQGREKEVLAGLTGEHKDDEELQAVQVDAKSNKGGWPGAVDDGWGQLFETLDDFPYQHYGINQS